MTIQKDIERKGIPFYLVDELFSKLEYGTTLSVAIKMLHFTGCRISELDNMQTTLIQGNVIFWKCGKTQKGFRKEFLPDHYLDELKYYREQNNVPSTRLFSANHETIGRRFRREIRPLLSQEWHRKDLILEKAIITEEYKYKLKGFRKNFATLLFAYFWDKYKDSGLATLRVCKRMRHSSKNITAEHYIESLEQIRADKFKEIQICEVVNHTRQKLVCEFF